MEKSEKFQRLALAKASTGRGKKIGDSEYINENCWLVKTLNYPSSKRCQYCELEFHNCLFFQYLIISLILILFLLTLSFLIEGKISKLVIISIFVLVIIYGYFFNKSTEKIIEANFAQRKAKESLEELTENLQQRVEEQTKEIRKAYEVERQAGKELQKLDEAKNQFIMATQHHLRTPLTAMRGYIDLLLTGSYGKLPQKIKEPIKRFEISTNRLLRIANELLDISQFQLGREVVSPQPNIDVMLMIKEIVEELKFEAEMKHIYLKLKKSEGKVPLINADPEKLKVALFNFVDNSVKYTNKGGVVVGVEPSDHKIRITVKDTGIGISKEDLVTLFGRIFERSKEAQKTHVTGRGIGLFITNHIIKSHKGRVWAESEGLGKGSTFYVELPV